MQDLVNLALKDIANSLDMKGLPYKIAGDIITIKLSDAEMLKIWIHYGVHNNGEYNYIGYKITVRQTGNTLESSNINMLSSDKMLADCNDDSVSRCWRRTDGHGNYRRVGKLGETDLTDLMPNAIGELNTIIDFYAK